MRVRCLVMLIMALAPLMPAVAEEQAPSYTLEEIQVMARSIHPTLEAADAAVLASSGLLRQSKAYPNPEIVIGYGQGRPRDGGDSRSENQLIIRQPIEMSGLRKWRKQQAEVRYRSVEIERVLAQTVVDSTVSVLVYTVLLEERRAEVARESAAVAGRLHDLLARGVEIGESSPFEVAKVRTEWFARRRDLLDAEGGAGASRSALRSFCGGKLPHEFSLDETLHGAKLRELPTNLVELLRVRNPLLLLAGTTLEEAEVATEVAKKDVFPDIDLFGRHVTELDRTAWRAGIGLTIPLWNHNRGTVISATAQQSVASADARTLALELENSLQQATVDYQLALGEIQLHQEGWTSAARQSLDIVTFSFENGEASLLDVLDAQRSYLSVGLAEAESWARLAFARTDIERLIAGPLAWENTDE